MQRNPGNNDNGERIEAVSSNIDDRTMHELYLYPFANAIRAGAASIMCSYQRGMARLESNKAGETEDESQQSMDRMAVKTARR